MDIFRLRQNGSRTGLLTRSMKSFGNMEKVWRGRNMNGLKENQIQMNGAAESYGQQTGSTILSTSLDGMQMKIFGVMRLWYLQTRKMEIP